jgi:hypothetical protein
VQTERKAKEKNNFLCFSKVKPTFDQRSEVRIRVQSAKFIGTLYLPPIPTIAVAPFLVVATFGIYLTTEDIETIAHVEHRIGIDAVEACIAATGGRNPTVVVTLLSQQVVEIQRHDERLALQEAF